jgi:hypothetical protein
VIEITKLQEKILLRFASGKSQIYAALKSIESDGSLTDSIDKAYEEAMQLVDFDLALDVSTQPAFKKVLREYKKLEGRTVNVLAPTKITELMFNRAGSRTVN